MTLRYALILNNSAKLKSVKSSELVPSRLLDRCHTEYVNFSCLRFNGPELANWIVQRMDGWMDRWMDNARKCPPLTEQQANPLFDISRLPTQQCSVTLVAHWNIINATKGNSSKQTNQCCFFWKFYVFMFVFVFVFCICIFICIYVILLYLV